MSQHKFTDDDYHVSTGWDPPLQHFFLTIHALDGQGHPRYIEEDPAMVFSSLDHPNFERFSLKDLDRTLTAFEIKAPDGLFPQLEKDRADDQRVERPLTVGQRIVDALRAMEPSKDHGMDR